MLLVACAVLIATFSLQNQEIAVAQTSGDPAGEFEGRVNRISKSAPGEPESVSPEDIKGWSIELERMGKALAREGQRDEDFEQLHNDAAIIQTNAGKLSDAVLPQLASLKEQFAQLGSPPDKDQPPETEAITKKRADLSAKIAEIDGTIKAAQLVIVKAKQLRNLIIDARRSRFVKSVTSKSFSIFDTALWLPFKKDVAFFGKGLTILFSNIGSSISNNLEKSGNSIIMIFGSVLVLLLVLHLFYRMLGNIRKRVGKIETDRSLLALRSLLHSLAYGVIPGLFIVGVVWIGDSFKLVTGSHRLFLFGVAFAFAIALTVLAIVYSFLRPGPQDERISKLSDDAAQKVLIIVSVAMAVFALSWFIYDAGRAMAASFEFGIAVKTLFSLSIAVLTGIIIRLINQDRLQEDLPPTGAGLSILLNWNIIRAAVGGGLAIIFFSLLTGYAALAEFAANQIILSSVVLALLWLVLKIMDNNIVGCFQASHTINKSISEYLGWKRKFTEQVGVVLTGLTRLSVILIALLGLLFPWGYRARDWVEWMSAAFFGFKVGDITISISVILSAFVVFVIGVIITRAMKRWLAVRYLPTTRLDAGIINSITTMFGYMGITIAAMVTVSYAGFDLSSLAFVAGALSVGIGFGLQSVVSNFVSGLILLVERPIKAGDWVVTSGGEGTVRKISVRSTEIETFDRATVILPNATLITDSVINWNHKSSMGRIKLAVGVDYDSDPHRVREILMERAKAHEGILDTPAPLVYFMDFGASSLDFELRCYLADVGNGMSVRSDLRYEIFAALNAEGISIPFPQQDVHIKGFDGGGVELIKNTSAANTKPGVANKSTKKPVVDAE